MTKVLNLQAATGKNIIGDDTTPVLNIENSSTGIALHLQKDVSGSATVPVLKIQASTASAPALSFAGSCIVSTASGGATVGVGIRTKFGDKYFWIYGYENIA
jgi:hypothetical protein